MQRPATAGQVGQYALHVAVAQGRVAEARRLIRDGADPREHEEREGWTPLHVAAGLGHTEAACLLLEERALPDAKDKAGWTAMHTACRFGHAPVVEALMDAGADPHARADQSGRSPAEYAAENAHLHVLELIVHKLGQGARQEGRPPAATGTSAREGSGRRLDPMLVAGRMRPRATSATGTTSYVPTAIERTTSSAGRIDGRAAIEGRGRTLPNVKTQEISLPAIPCGGHNGLPPRSGRAHGEPRVQEVDRLTTELRRVL
eukprot:CAMPEP_0114228840 /NCGR_PEP_ID=MMETSP0058-20121206/2574_1 /TAXON_ID=36894 /ORGANISM="Pyramimonas parkeae, CCMP726" /LENGTH=259 /DNA_ID=CAMNT_0001339847 /DNA_START=233 /DNA_END=1012 /DNA_ORIENTATION=+